MMDASDKLLTVTEVARYLGVSPHTVYRWIATGRLPSARFSRKVLRVRKEDLEAFSRSGVGRIGEPQVSYQPGSQLSEAEYERKRQRVRRLLEKYRKLSRKPRPKGAPPKGSPQALLEVAGIITKEEGEELRRVIREAKTFSPPVEL